MNGPALLTTVGLYLAAIAGLAYLGYRRTASDSDYLVAGRSVHPLIMACSYGATFISTAGIIGFGGVAALYGMALLWLIVFNLVVGILIAFVVFGKRTRRLAVKLDAQTFPELLGRHFDSSAIQGFAGLVIALAMPLYTALVLVGGARFVEATLEIGFGTALAGFAVIVAAYVIAGGMKGILYTDSLQGGIMVVAVLVLVILTYLDSGGITETHRSLTEMLPLVPETLAAQGHQGWTAMPAWGTPWWWTLFSSLILGVGIGILAQPQLIVRFMTVGSNRALSRGVPVGAVFLTVLAGGALLVGALCNVYFFTHEGQIAIEAAGGNLDSIIPLYIGRAMPPWFGHLFMVTLLAAAMSTLSSQLHVAGTAIGRDLLNALGMGGAKRATFYSRLGVVVSLLTSVMLAALLPAGVVARGTAIFFGICAATFLPAYTSALFWPRATRNAVLASMATGLGVSLFCLAFLHEHEAAPLGLCRLLFGRDILITQHPWPWVDPILIALPAAVLVLWVMSRMSPLKVKGT
jgi:SSS family solute:Na+ symporter